MHVIWLGPEERGAHHMAYDDDCDDMHCLPAARVVCRATTQGITPHSPVNARTDTQRLHSGCLQNLHSPQYAW